MWIRIDQTDAKKTNEMNEMWKANNQTKRKKNKTKKNKLNGWINQLDHQTGTHRYQG